METKKFKCKDEVIYKVESENALWTYGIFSHLIHYEDGTSSAVVNGHILDLIVYKILPYEGNEELVGKTDSPDEEVKLVVTEKVMAQTHNENWIYATHISVFIMEDLFNVRLSNGEDIKVKKVVKFSDFNPNDMEETKKHILCVKGGKVVKLKN